MNLLRRATTPAAAWNEDQQQARWRGRRRRAAHAGRAGRLGRQRAGAGSSCARGGNGVASSLWHRQVRFAESRGTRLASPTHGGTSPSAVRCALPRTPAAEGKQNNETKTELIMR